MSGLSFYEGIRIGTGADYIELDNVNFTTASGPGYGSPYRDEATAVNQGGFGRYVHDSSFAINGGTGAFPTMWFSGQGSSLKGSFSRIFLSGGGVKIDRADLVSGGILGIYRFHDFETEGLPVCFLEVNGSGGTLEQIELEGIEMSDNVFATNSLICNLTSTFVNSFTVINSRAWGGGVLGGDNIRGVNVIGGVTDGGANDTNTGIGSGAGLVYTILAHNGNFITNGAQSAFGASIPVAGIGNLFQRTDVNVVPLGVRDLASAPNVDLFQVQDSAANPLVGIGRGPTFDRQIWYNGGAIRSRVDAGGDFVIRTDGLTAGLATGAFLTIGAFANVPGLIIGPASGSQDSMQIFHTGSSTNKIFAVDSGDNTLIKRMKASQGTALATGDFALSAGWGNTAAVSAVTGTDQGWQITVTSSGTGQAASPTVTLTFKDGTWTNAPICVSKMVGGTGTITQLTEAPVATTNTLTFQGTPVAASTYILASVCMGR